MWNRWSKRSFKALSVLGAFFVTFKFYQHGHQCICPTLSSLHLHRKNLKLKTSNSHIFMTIIVCNCLYICIWRSQWVKFMNFKVLVFWNLTHWSPIIGKLKILTFLLLSWKFKIFSWWRPNGILLPFQTK